MSSKGLDHRQAQSIAFYYYYTNHQTKSLVGIAMCRMTVWKENKRWKHKHTKLGDRRGASVKELWHRPENCLSSLRGNANWGHPCENIFLNISFWYQCGEKNLKVACILSDSLHKTALGWNVVSKTCCQPVSARFQRHYIWCVSRVFISITRLGLEHELDPSCENLTTWIFALHSSQHIQICSELPLELKRLISSSLKT